MFTFVKQYHNSPPLKNCTCSYIYVVHPYCYMFSDNEISWCKKILPLNVLPPTCMYSTYMAGRQEGMTDETTKVISCTKSMWNRDSIQVILLIMSPFIFLKFLHCFSWVFCIKLDQLEFILSSWTVWQVLPQSLELP